MKSFQFRLEKVLDWRRTRLELEEANYRRHLTVLAEIDRQDADITASARQAEEQVRAWSPVNGLDLDALDSYRIHARGKRKELASTRAEAARRLAAQQALMLEERRKVRLLERLREHQLAEWRAALDKETEETAAESFLAHFARDCRPQSG
jgi:flagellar export protein FliJ